MSERADSFIAQVADEVERALDGLLPLRQVSPEAALYRAMRYSLFAGGKRLRPALFCAAAELFGREREPLLPFAGGLELIHTYSLIHDDLPAMDNDDLRRGLPTCHRAFGEATAILAGDGLLTQAFVLMTGPAAGVAPASQLAAVNQVALLAGIGGMVSGQAAELAALERQQSDAELIAYIYRGKTGALLTAALVSAALLCDAAAEEVAALRECGLHLGLAFQIADDILDISSSTEALGKPVGSDAKRELPTYAALLGCDQARQRLKQEAEAAVASLSRFGQRSALLQELAWRCAIRDK